MEGIFQVTRMIESADDDGDMLIDQQEFISLMKLEAFFCQADGRLDWRTCRAGRLAVGRAAGRTGGRAGGPCGKW